MAKQPTHSRGEGTIKLTDIDASDRIRELTPDVMKYIEEDLAPSIAEHGLIQPVVLDDKNRLIAGGCRYTAFKLLQFDKIPYVTRAKLSPSDAKLLELEENLRRKKMRWQEVTLGIYSAHQLKKKESSKVQAKWGVRQTGALLGVSHATVGDSLIVAEYLIKGDKEVLEAQTFEKAQSILASRKQDIAMKQLATLSASPIIISTAFDIEKRTTSGPIDTPLLPSVKSLDRRKQNRFHRKSLNSRLRWWILGRWCFIRIAMNGLHSAMLKVSIIFSRTFLTGLRWIISKDLKASSRRKTSMMLKRMLRRWKGFLLELGRFSANTPIAVSTTLLSITIICKILRLRLVMASSLGRTFGSSLTELKTNILIVCSVSPLIRSWFFGKDNLLS